MATATKARRGKTDEQRAAEVEALTDKLHAAVADLTSSEAWLRMLAVSARFTRYSWRNQVLLWLQAEDRGVTITRVAGYRKWAELGQQVTTGAKAFQILAPVHRRLSAEEAAKWAAQGKTAFDGDGRPIVVVRGFRIENVFDESQTQPMEGREPLPKGTPWIEQTGNGPNGLWDALVALTEGEGFALELRPPAAEDGGAHGWTNYATRVWVNDACDEAERIRILAHETAGHIRCDHENRCPSRAQRECEADSVAYVVCAALGLDISASSVDYMADWSRGDTDVLEEALTAIHLAAASVLADIEADEDEGDG